MTRPNHTPVPNHFVEKSNDLSDKAFRFYVYLCKGLSGTRMEGEKPDNRVWHKNAKILSECPFLRNKSQIVEVIQELNRLGFVDHYYDKPPKLDAKYGIIPGEFYSEHECHMFRIPFENFMKETDYALNLKKIQDERQKKNDGIRDRLNKNEDTKEKKKYDWPTTKG